MPMNKEWALLIDESRHRVHRATQAEFETVHSILAEAATGFDLAGSRRSGRG
jgi:hypothetical protein